MVLANDLPTEIGGLHAHFLHTPASVARYAATMRNLPWSASAHAKDIWTMPDWEKREKLADCRWLVTCTKVNADHLTALAPEPGRVELLYHGMDFTRFPRGAGLGSGRNGRDPADPAIVLSVGRAVAKKGYALLLDALAELPPELAWRLVHIGDGPLLYDLQRRAKSLAIADRIAWLGARSQQDVLRAYRAADLFVLACRIAEDGDRDGLPNVLMEAQSQGLACISTTVSAIPELIDDGETGLLVPPDDPAGLARAIERLIRFPDLRVLLGAAGMRRVRSRFSLERGIDRLAGRFGVEAGARQIYETCESRSMRR
jgi:glycosyltransferase involved in cell wall biosynthesis